MDTDILKKIGLTDSQSKAYFALLEHGELSPAELSEHIGETRTNCYAISEKLISLGLAIRSNIAKSAIKAENPTKIKTLLSLKQKQLKTVNDELAGVMPTLLSQFHLTSDQPGIISVEGINALKMVYDEILNTKQDILIFPSPYDHDDPDTSSLIKNQIKKQRESGIKSYGLLEYDEYDPTRKDLDEFVQVRRLPKGVKFNAQIIVFGNTVVSTTFRNGMLSTIINSPEMAETLRNVFFMIWESCRMD